MNASRCFGGRVVEAIQSDGALSRLQARPDEDLVRSNGERFGYPSDE